MALAAVVVGVLAMGIAGAFARQLGLRLTLVLSELLLLTPGVLLAAIAWRLPLRSALALAPVSRRVVWLSLLAGLAFWGGSLGLFELQYAVWPPPEGYLEMFRRLHAALRPSGPVDALASVAAIAIGPAVCEELLFRGLVLESLRPRFGAIGAVIGAAVAFSLIHVDASQAGLSLYRLPFALAVGLGLGALRLQAGSVVAPILAHALLNTVTFLVAPLTDPPGAELPEPQPALGVVLLSAGVATSVWLLRRVRVDSPSAAT